MIPSLNEFERSLIADANILLTKNEIINKVVKLFAELSDIYVTVAQAQLPGPYTSIPPKISKGEKYQGLPYVVLDYPRLFKQDRVAAIRTLFWWGNHFSITLHLQGMHQEKYASTIQSAIAEGKFDEWVIQVDGDAWQHALENPYEPVKHDKDYMLLQRSFVKLAKKTPLHQWDHIVQLTTIEFEKLLAILSTNAME
jgi:hypothetical protein